MRWVPSGGAPGGTKSTNRGPPERFISSPSPSGHITSTANYLPSSKSSISPLFSLSHSTAAFPSFPSRKQPTAQPPTHRRLKLANSGDVVLWAWREDCLVPLAVAGGGNESAVFVFWETSWRPASTRDDVACSRRISSISWWGKKHDVSRRAERESVGRRRASPRLAPGVCEGAGGGRGRRCCCGGRRRGVKRRKFQRCEGGRGETERELPWFNDK